MFLKLIAILFLINLTYQNQLHRRNFHKNRNLNNENNNNNSSKKRTIINGDYNLQRDYIAATVGKDVQLDCKMKNLVNEDDKIVWLKMPKGEVLTLNSNRVTPDQRINSKCFSNIQPCWSLMIIETRESDTGFYVCQTNAMHTKYIYLDIMVPPKLLTNYPVDRIDVNQSMNASLTCEFYGKPEPLIKWFKYHNGNPKEIEKFRGHKTIQFFIHKESPSEYECIADNSIPPIISKKIFLNIQYAPTVKLVNSKVFQNRGERVIFDVLVHSNPKAKIEWFKNKTKLVESNKYIFEELDNNLVRLYINNLIDEDFDEYTISVENHLGKSSGRIELIKLPSIILNDLSGSFTITTLKSTTENNENKINNNSNKNLRKVLIDSGNLKKSNDENLDDEYVFYKSTNSLLQFNNNHNKNRSTKFSAHRSNKQNNNNQTKLKMNRKQHLENIIGQSTSTVSFNMYELEYNSCSLIFKRSKFHYIFYIISSFYFISYSK